MATLSAAVLRTSTEDDLERQLREAKEELFNLRFQAATGQLESHGRLRTVRRDIARIYTVLRERELGIIGFIEPEVVTEEATEDEAVAVPEADSESEAEEAPAEEAEPKAKKTTAKKSAKKSSAKKSAAKKSAAKADEAETESTDEDASAEDGGAK